MQGAPFVTRFRIVFAALLAIVSTMAGCGDDASVLPTTTTIPAPTTSRAVVTLRGDGLGVVAFGAPFDSAARQLREALGEPDGDTTTVAECGARVASSCVT